MASSTAARRRSLTAMRRFRTFDTVPTDTPARRATSRIVGRPPESCLASSMKGA